MRYKDITPRYNQIITTAKRYEDDQLTEDGVLLGTKYLKGCYAFEQEVIKVGPNVRDLKPGDIVKIDFSNGRYLEYSDSWLRKNKSLAGLDPLARANHMADDGITIRYPVVVIDGKECFMVFDDDITFSFIPE